MPATVISLAAYRRAKQAPAEAAPPETRMFGGLIVAMLFAYGALFVWLARLAIERLV